MIYLPGLGLALGGLWFALSGQTDPLFLFFGVLSVIVAMLLSARLGVIDEDAAPYYRTPAFFAYNAWLWVEIVKSNIDVVKSVLDPSGGVDPGEIELDVGACKSDLAKQIFANSITLTPGTVTVDVDQGRMKVHALHKKNATEEAFARMLKLSARAADGKG